MTSVWPDVPAAASPSTTVRQQLDYVIWITEAMEPAGFHGGADLEDWRARSQRAYTALVDAMAPGHGDPFPPDVPPSVTPGTWPDVASAGIPGMTVRHQLAAVRAIAAHSRGDSQFPHAPSDLATWAARVQAAYDALDHGPSMAMPESARSLPPALPRPAGKPKTGRAPRAAGRRPEAKHAGKSAKSKATRGHGSAKRKGGTAASRKPRRR